MKNYDNIYELNCLAGEDMSRRPGKLILEAMSDGKILIANLGKEVKVEDGEVLRGWGDLGGPSVAVGNGIWYVNVPKVEWYKFLDATK